MELKSLKGVAACLLAIVAALPFLLHAVNFAPKTTGMVSRDADLDTDKMADNNQSELASVLMAMPNAKPLYRISSSTPQFVILSFDGSKSVEMLDETLVFQQKMEAEGKPLRFTYFINAAYFLTDANAALYQAPGGVPKGTSMIGFSDSASDIALRVREFNKAFAARNEIGSHTAGHFDGSAWTYDEWKQEFASFASLMSSVQQNNPSVQIDAPQFLADIRGFRAPDLGVNDNLYKTLSDYSFAYDASSVNTGDAWPQKIDGIWHIPLGTIRLPGDSNPVIAMDYNLWTRQSNAVEAAKKGTPLWNEYFDQVEKGYMDYFNQSYNGNRVPVVISGHFSKWNDGVYWEAMKAFAENVCGRPDVRCGTFSDLVDYLNVAGIPPRVK
ncbi:MAG: hypothetical protein P4L61_02595 [Candidatus Pacebacteria bacterium]|nr:hypothetical protein [Candidatus Paceibacterota bacterium]